jgi:hypothetical protein
MNIRYSRIAPDSTDVSNEIGDRSGYFLRIAENDEGVIIEMMDIGREKVDFSEYKGIFVGFSDAEEILRGLKEAVELAKNKGKGEDLHAGLTHDP